MYVCIYLYIYNRERERYYEVACLLHVYMYIMYMYVMYMYVMYMYIWAAGASGSPRGPRGIDEVSCCMVRAYVCLYICYCCHTRGGTKNEHDFAIL